MLDDSGLPLDHHQYSVSGLRTYEAIYGTDFISPGGRSTTAELLALVDWRPGMSVLDVGCGLGGAAFMMATEYGADVVGIDLSRNMIREATRRSDAYGLADRVELEHGDILALDPDRNFDLIHSREVFLHIHDKVALFATLHEALEPHGHLMFTDYCRSAGESTESFADYVEEFGYDLRTVDQIESLLIDAGFVEVVALDRTEMFIEIHEAELAGLAEIPLSRQEQEDLAVGWRAKIDRARRGEQRWGLFQARR